MEEITADDLADLVHLLLRSGTFGEAIKAYGQGKLAAYDAQRKASAYTLEPDDTEYAEMVGAQLQIQAQINDAHQERAWLRLYGAKCGDVEGNGTGHSTHSTTHDHR